MNLELLIGGGLALVLTIGHGIYIGEYFILRRTPTKPLPSSPFGDGAVSKAVARASVHTLTWDYLAAAIVLVFLSFSTPDEPHRLLASFISILFAGYGIVCLAVIGYQSTNWRWINPLLPSAFFIAHRQAKAGIHSREGWFPPILIPISLMFTVSLLTWQGPGPVELFAGVLIAGVSIAIAAAVLFRALALLLLRVAVPALIRFMVLKKSRVLEDKPAADGRPLWNFLTGFKYGMRWSVSAIKQRFMMESTYNKFVLAEGIGLALRTRRALLLGPRNRDDFEKSLPPTVSIGRGVYYAFKYKFLGKSVPKTELPDGLLEGTRDGLDAFLRTEAFACWLVQGKYVRGQDAANKKLFEDLAQLAAAQTQPGVGASIAFGYGLAAYFISRDKNELYRLIDGLSPSLRSYGLMGAGPPLINTVTDDVTRFREGFARFHPADRSDVLAGVVLILGVASRFVGPDFLNSFTGLSAAQKSALEQLARDYEEVPPAIDLASMAFGELRKIAARNLEAVSAAFGARFAPLPEVRNRTTDGADRRAI